MKLIVRTFVITLALTGAFASAYTPVSSSLAARPKPDNKLPIPMCPPDDPGACGMGPH